MKIEFLNKERSRARVTKGWFRKRQALVEKKTPEMRNALGLPYVGWPKDWWYHAESGAPVRRRLFFKLEKAERADTSLDWQRVGTPFA